MAGGKGQGEKGAVVVKASLARVGGPGLGSWPRGRLGEIGKTLKLGARSLDHLLQVDHKLGVHGIVGRSEGVQRCRAGGVENPEHAQLLKGGLVDSGVFLLAEGQNPLATTISENCLGV